MSRQRKLAELVAKFSRLFEKARPEEWSEETTRDYISQLLAAFGWDTGDTSQVLQEKKLTPKGGVSHDRPDYWLHTGKRTHMLVDAKNATADIFLDQKGAFQVRSYGWSAGAPCSILTNFRQLSIYDCRFKPDSNDPPATARVIHLTSDQFDGALEQLDLLLDRDKIKAGSLEARFGADVPVEGSRALDEDFAEHLSRFRKQLASQIAHDNSAFLKTFGEERIGYLTQVILDRIIFIRVAESKGLESEETLLNFCKKDFWVLFSKASSIEFLKRYDGPLFDPAVDLSALRVSGPHIHKFIQSLYYPAPYKFEAIPVKLLADIYERFLSTRLILRGTSIIEQSSDEKTTRREGSVSTPNYLVEALGVLLFERFQKCRSIDDLLAIAILDPACGSGTFLTAAYDALEERAIDLFKRGQCEGKYKKWFAGSNGDTLLTVEGKRGLISNCIFGVDVQPEAVEVARMALALKVIEGAEMHPARHGELGLLGIEILNGIGANIRTGNALVDISAPVAQDPIRRAQILPFSFEAGFPAVFTRGGFDFIIGNPPYVEPKRFKAALPEMHAFLRKHYESFASGKVDLAVGFIERCQGLLNDKGRLGFLVQQRFFKTEYGAKIRGMLTSKKLLHAIVDFESTRLFRDRNTYVAFLILDKRGNPQVACAALEADPPALIAQVHELVSAPRAGRLWKNIRAEHFGSEPWELRNLDLAPLKVRAKSLGTLGDVPGLHVRVGLQALWGRAYHLRGSLKNGLLHVTNSLESEEFQIEADSCRPVICNEHFFPFRPVRPDVYCLFPYTEQGERIAFPEYSALYPLAGAYLAKHKATILREVEVRPGRYWHTFTREQNLIKTGLAQVLIPMTARDTFSAVDLRGELYCDNANVNAITVEGWHKNQVKALAAMVNSTVFSVFARLGANPQLGGGWKFNKQFLLPVPFPVKAFMKSDGIVVEMAHLSDRIANEQARASKGNMVDREMARQVLVGLWRELDALACKAFQLKAADEAALMAKGRAEDRVAKLAMEIQ